MHFKIFKINMYYCNMRVDYETYFFGFMCNIFIKDCPSHTIIKLEQMQ